MGQQRPCGSIPLIREAGAGDEALLAGLIARSFADVARRFGLDSTNCPKHPSNCTETWVHRDLARGVRYFLLERGGGPAGCVALERAAPASAYLERLAVLPRFRCRGYGRQLVDHVIEAARHLHVRKLGIGIIADQTELKRWYQRIGFVEGETRSFAHLPFSVAFLTLAISR